MAVSHTCKKYSSLKLSTLFSNINLISRQISSLEVVDSALLSRCFLQAPIPSLWGMLEYKAVTSNVTKMVLSGKLLKRLSLFKKSVVSLMQLGIFASRGWSSLSTNAETYSGNVPMPDAIVRPGGLMLSPLGFDDEVVRIGTGASRYH